MLMLGLSVAVTVLGFASCSVTCPDGKVCSDSATCCAGKDGSSCCPYPNAVCCSDLTHCCPSGSVCNLDTQRCEKQKEPWMNLLVTMKEAAEKPSNLDESASDPQEVTYNQKSSVVYCDPYTVCPDRTTCCRHPTGAWFCCLYYPGKCCLDGYHCCPYGFDCDLTYTHCVRQGLPYPFIRKQVPSSVPAVVISRPGDKSILQETPMTLMAEAIGTVNEAGIIRCDSSFYCPQGASCCNGPTGLWSCCPYKLGQCCADGQHCCGYGYTCEPLSSSCRRRFSQIPSQTQERAKTL